MQTKVKFYKNRVCINCLAGNLQNAKEVVEVLEGAGCVGLMSASFPTIAEGVKEVKSWLKELPCVSVGLGAGDPKYSLNAALIAAETDPGHVNQTFPYVGFTSGYFKAKNVQNTLINALVSPTGIVGKVRVATGPLSYKEKDGILDVESAIAMIMEMGGASVKFYPMNALEYIDEFRYIVKASVKMGLKLIEPTGGITADNLAIITAVALEEGMEQCMPHIYTSIIDKNTGLTRIDALKKIFADIKAIVG